MKARFASISIVLAAVLVATTAFAQRDTLPYSTDDGLQRRR
jgi:hypothetical protein